MPDLVMFAAKSFVVAGVALLLLKAMQKRSATDRSWIAHLGLVALLALPIVSFAAPAWEVAGPDFLAREAAVLPAVELRGTEPQQAEVAAADATAATFPAPQTQQTAQSEPAAASAIDWHIWVYAAPAALLILLTLIALGRLVVLKSRANVLVEPHWLTALAHAQQRMGFKNGTALLTSDELPSPISWGLLRPVILLNSEAAKSRDQAEAIIAHELAHVARLDWLKLMISRVAVALFWFNPLVWLLAREAHQLREEAADDAVLSADIEDTDYARLLVGVARHDCRGLLIGAHGVAPGQSSLSRRVRRVLDSALARAPGGWRWTSAAAFFAAGMAVPVAALSFVAPAGAKADSVTNGAPQPSRPGTSFAAHITDSPNGPSVSELPAAAELKAAATQVATAAAAAGAAASGAAGIAAAEAAGEWIETDEDFSAVALRGGGRVIVRPGSRHGARIVRGGNDSTQVSADGDNVAISCGGGCEELVVEVVTPNLDAIAVDGSGSVEVARGFRPMSDLALAVRGSGRIDARNVTGHEVAAAVSGSGTILTSASGELAASTRGSGNIRYWGAADVSSAVQGSGSVQPGG